MDVRQRRRFGAWLGVMATAYWAAGAAHALPAGRAASEIERLILYVERLKNVRIVGGPFEVSATNAARFLRHQLAAQGDQVSNAEEFIRRCATRSDATGRAYEVHWPGGAVRPAAEVLVEALRELRALGS